MRWTRPSPRWRRGAERPHAPSAAPSAPPVLGSAALTWFPGGTKSGLLLVVAATVFAILFGGEHALSLDSAGRLFIVCVLAVFAHRGRRWAEIALGVIVLTAAVGLMLGAVRVGLNSGWGVVFALDALLFMAGLAWFLLARRRARPDGERGT